MARERQLAAAARGRALHGGDDGRAAQLNLVAALLPALDLAAPARLAQHFQLRDVRARAEVLPRAAQDYGAQVAARGDTREDVADAYQHRARQRVSLRRSFEPDEEERTAFLSCDFCTQGVRRDSSAQASSGR